MGRAHLSNGEKPLQAPDGKENFIEHIDKKRSLFVNTFHKHCQLKGASGRRTGRQIEACSHPSWHAVRKTFPGVWQTHEKRKKKPEQNEEQPIARSD